MSRGTSSSHGHGDGMGGLYWMVSLPLSGGSKEASWDNLQQLTVYANDLSLNFKLNVPDTLRVGTLDALMELSDDLVKSCASIEGTLAKLRRQCTEAARARVTGDDPADAAAADDEDGFALDAEDLPCEDARAIESFEWNEAKFPSHRPLKESVERILSEANRVDDTLKLKASECQSARAAVSAMLRKRQGSLAVRDVASLGLPPEDFVETENLTTVLVAIPKHRTKEFGKAYEQWARFSFLDEEKGRSAHVCAAVPRSARDVAQDKEFVLTRVVVFRKMLDVFKGVAREKGFQVREYKYDGAARDEEAQGFRSASREARHLQHALMDWSLTSYKEVLGCWMHILSIRIFVESILRYGLPPSFQAAVIKPHSHTRAKVRAALASQFGGLVSNHWKNTQEEQEQASSKGGADAEVFPYVSFTVNFNK